MSTISFLVISLSWTKLENGKGCNPEVGCFSNQVTPKAVDRLEPILKRYTECQIWTRLQRYIQAENCEPSVWRNRTLFTLALDRKISCINFFPFDISKPHLVHIEKLEGDAIPPNKTVYEHVIAGSPVILPTGTFPDSDHVFNLSRMEISLTLEGLAVDHSLVAKALKCFVEDIKTRAIALTLEKTHETYIWLKG